jgi:hypothetical protein
VRGVGRGEKKGERSCAKNRVEQKARANTCACVCVLQHPFFFEGERERDNPPELT